MLPLYIFPISNKTQYEALRRVHLIPTEDAPADPPDFVNTNVFQDLDSRVSEGGENFSTG